MFASNWVLAGHPFSKRDDAIAIVLNLLFFRDSKTSWFREKANEPFETVVDWRLNSATNKQICGGNRCKVLLPLYEEVNSYKEDEVPNYSKCRFLLLKVLMENFCKPDNYYSFF